MPEYSENTSVLTLKFISTHEYHNFWSFKGLESYFSKSETSNSCRQTYLSYLFSFLEQILLKNCCMYICCSAAQYEYCLQQLHSISLNKVAICKLRIPRKVFINLLSYQKLTSRFIPCFCKFTRNFPGYFKAKTDETAKQNKLSYCRAGFN